MKATRRAWRVLTQGLRTVERISVVVEGQTHKRALEKRFPFLKNYGVISKRIINEVRPAYEQYVSNVSSPYHAISLETLALLLIFCEAFRPKCILELGSGFSSFVLRSYAVRHENVTVWSVDDRPEWLQRTREYLLSHNLPDSNLLLWDELLHLSDITPDFIIHDLGRMEVRQDSLCTVLKWAERGGALVFLDDVHKEVFGAYVQNVIRRISCNYFKLIPYTLDSFGRYCGLVCDVTGTDLL